MLPERPWLKSAGWYSGAWGQDPYRYLLWRRWSPSAAPLLFVMLNPSTADAKADDPTIRRCIDRARRCAFGGLTVVNLYAWRSKSPGELAWQRRDGRDVVGPLNRSLVEQTIAEHDDVVVAWGGRVRLNAWMRERAEEVERLARKTLRTWCLGQTLYGEPRHPLFVSSSQPLEKWSGFGRGGAK